MPEKYNSINLDFGSLYPQSFSVRYRFSRNLKRIDKISKIFKLSIENNNNK